MTARAGDAASGARRWWRRQRWRSILPIAAAALALLVALLAIGRDVERHLSGIESWITGLGPWGIVGFVVLYVVLTSVLVPESLLAVVAGAVFGLAWGALALVAGVLLAASIQYALARKVFRRPIERSMNARPRFAALVRAVRRNEFRLQVLIRLTPINPASTSYALGAAEVRFVGFIVACIALLPGAMIEFALGRAGRHVARMAGHGESTALLHDAVLLGGIAAIVAAVAIVSRFARQAVQRELDTGAAAG